jgi:nicotinate-nucleotide pyrophosphorylase (carboxylating)
MIISRSQFARDLFTNRDYFQTKKYFSFSSKLLNSLANEDVLDADITSRSVFEDKYLQTISETVVIAKSLGVIAGLQEVSSSFSELNFEVFIKDGEVFKPGDVICKIKGTRHAQLKYERIILNTLIYLSSIASENRQILAEFVESEVVFASTRKTLYGPLDKKAAYLGGAATHRINLNDAILVKDTHLDYFNRDLDLLIDSLINSSFLKTAKFIEIEVESRSEALDLLAKLPDLFVLPFVIMLDNFSAQAISETIEEIKNQGLFDKALFEASGGIDRTNLQAYAKTGVDIISSSIFTKPTSFIDLSVKTHQL